MVCLVLAAAPTLPNAPNVLEEHRDVQQSIVYSRYGHTIRLDTLPAARWEDLAQYLSSTTPHVLHFAGRGTPDGGPRFVTDDGGEAPVSTDGLRTCVTTAAATGLHLLILNACWTARLAKELTDAVPTVIGWQAQVADLHARGYARVFYRNLATGASVAKAHATACMMLSLSGCVGPPLLHSAVDHIPEAHFLISPEARPVPPGQPVKPRQYEAIARLRKQRFVHRRPDLTHFSGSRAPLLAAIRNASPSASASRTPAKCNSRFPAPGSSSSDLAASRTYAAEPSSSVSNSSAIRDSRLSASSVLR